MGSYFSIDVAELHMFSGREWWELGDLCAHDCPHHSIAVIGWGPDVAHYELEECRDCGCRGWRDGRWTKARQVYDGSDGFWWGRIEWRQPPHNASGAAT